MNARQLLELVVRPTINALNAGGKNVEQLIMGTIAQESDMGRYIKQTVGPARGICQMEPRTHDDLVKTYIFTNPLRHGLYCALLGGDDNFTADRLIWDLRYSVALCRAHYQRIRMPIPPADNWTSIAAYYKQYYNSPLGKATAEQFLSNVDKHGLRSLW